MWRECGAIGPGCWRMTETREKRVRRQGDAAGRTATGHFTGHESHSQTQRSRQTAERLMSGDWEVHATAPRTGWAVTHTSHIDHIEDTRDRAHLGSGILDRSCGRKIITIPSESRFHVTRISYRYRKGVIRYHIVRLYILASPHASASRSRSRSCKAVSKLR